MGLLSRGRAGAKQIPVRHVEVEQAERELHFHKDGSFGITRVVLAEDHLQVRAGIRLLLERSDDIQVVGEASNGLQALEMVDEMSPDVLVLDIEMPVMGGGQVAERLRREKKAVSVLVLSAHDDSQYILKLFQQGVSGYVIKEEAPDVLVMAVRAVAGGKDGWMSRKTARRLRRLPSSDEVLG